MQAMIRRELIFFILNGIVSVIIAYVIYRSLVYQGALGVNASNGVAYVSGMAFGFFANRKWAFQDRQMVSGGKIFRYISLHAFTLFVNIFVNSFMLKLVYGMFNDILISFLVAISTSTILNFIGLKYFVFNYYISIVADIKKLREFF
jgi:putative flippase GtrA